MLRSSHPIQSLALSALVASGLAPLAAQVASPVATPLRAYDQGLREPVRLATDASGRLYITDGRLNLVTVRDENGRLVHVKRGLSRPLGLAVDASGYIYVCEAGRGRVSLFTSGWVEAGSLGQGDGEFRLPNHITVDASGQVYVVDSAAAQVKVYGANRLLLHQFGTPGRAAGQLDFPTGLAVTPSGEIFVSDQGNERIQVFDATGAFLRQFGGTVGMAGTNTSFGRIQGLLADGLGRLYLADTFRGKVTVINSTGGVLGTLGEFGSGPGQLMGPASLALDRNNRLFVASAGNARIEVFGLDSYQDPNLLTAQVVVAPTDLVRSAHSGRDESEEGKHRHHENGEGKFRHEHEEHARLVQRLDQLVSVLIKLPGVDLSTLRANGVPPTHVPGAILGDFDGDGSFEYRAWFDRRQLTATMPDGEAFLVLTGTLADGRPFESIANMRVLPAAGGVQ